MFLRYSYTIPACLLLFGFFIYGCNSDKPTLEFQVAQLIRQLDGDYTQRRSASKSLIKIGEPAIPALIKTAHVADPALRREAISALGHIGSPKAIPALVERAIMDPDIHNRWRGAWAINLADNGSAQASLQKYLNAENQQHRWNAAVALSALNNKEIVPILHQGLESEDVQTRWEAINALGRVYNSQTASLLIKAYDYSDIDMRQAIILSLGKIGTPDVVDTIIWALDNRESKIRCRAAMALGWIGNDSAIKALQSRLKSEKDSNVKVHIAKSLRFCLNPEGSERIEVAGKID